MSKRSDRLRRAGVTMSTMRIRLISILGVLGLLWLGCGDDLGPRVGPDGGGGGNGGGNGGADAGPDAAAECPAPAELGAPCEQDEECDSAEDAGDGVCARGAFRGQTWPEAGFCSRTCDPDAEEATCGAEALCATHEGFDPLCLPLCCQGDACAAGLACSQRVLGEDELAMSACLPGDPSAADGAACATFGECAGNSQCVPDQSGTSGVCTTVGCTVGDDETCAPAGDGRCVDLDGEGGEVPRCVDPCETTADCDTGDGQRCHDSGDEDIGMYCRHSEIGDPCGSGAECGQDPWLCMTEADDEWPGGYCSIPCAGGCPAGTVCNDSVLSPGTPFCVESCTVLLDECSREGYLCQDVNTAGGLQLGCAPTIDI
jgi:hypothetical protein